MAGQFTEMLLKVLGVEAYRRYRSQESQQATPQPGGSDTGGASLWVRAGEDVSTQASPPPDGGGADRVPWATVETTASTRTLWVWRVALIAVLALPWTVGAWHMIRPSAAATSGATKSAAPFASTAAAAVAQRFASAYLSWDQDDPDARLSALSLDVPGLSGDDKFGWNGKGRQVAGTATTLSVTPSTSTVATVTVAVRVVPYGSKGGAEKARWVGLAVPVQERDGRFVVTGQPAAVAVPRPAESSMTRPNRDEDAALGRRTESYATSFFTAYGTNDDVSAVAAPSAHIAGLNGLYMLDELTTWQVFAGRGSTREAFATVQWKTAGDATITQNYDVTLTQVTSGDTVRWQVASIDAATD
ncbi:conjugal transfer protein [Curtobacterium flaccumfaciens pv. oortii]|uniref:conjugal transfer protein n=1 Tax=Curtobacterium flaccumfaciens TaxID=2035 RepID=UPI002657ECF3|nr:conjugal transfer protein [Curtobacterium flaccumfaciens]MCS5524840.1 conjugal transfer protein [Curtobacterium flaccumfaciens pv. oortii]